MKTHLDGSGQELFPAGALLSREEKPDDGAGSDSRSPLPEGWRRLSTGLRGTWLYHVTQPDGPTVYWEGELLLNGERVRRRFASELHARVWLHLAAEPRFPRRSADLKKFTDCSATPPDSPAACEKMTNAEPG